MRDKRISLVMAALLGCLALFQAGCKKGEEPGTAIDLPSEIFNIKYAIKKAGPGIGAEQRIEKLRRAYGAAGELNQRWPDDPSIDPFLDATADTLNQIPRTVYALSLETRDLESFKWALSQPGRIDIDAHTLMKIWQMGAQWSDFVLQTAPERALPLYMEAAVEQRNVAFFNAHIEAFKSSGYTLYSPVESTIFYLKYCRFMAEQFAKAAVDKNQERIRSLLTYMPKYSAVKTLAPKTLVQLKALGDYLFYEQKDEALAIAFIELGYPVNPIELSRTQFSSGFVETLTAEPMYAITAFQLDQWHGSLGQRETQFLISLSDELLQTVDPRYLEETIKLCLAKNKNELAQKLIQARFPKQPLDDADHDKMLSWAILSGNNNFLKHVLAQKKMSIQQIGLAQLAGNEKMFMKYAGSILSYIEKNEGKETDDGPSLGDSIREVVMSEHHAAGLYLIKKYDLAKKWERLPSEPTLLMEVCLAGNLPAAKYLMELKREDPHQKTRYTRKETTLFGAAVAAEGDLNLLHLAAQSGNSALIKYLVSKKISVNDRTYFGVTPLMYAAGNGHLEATQMLISLGANVNAAMKGSLKNEPMPEEGTFSQLSTAYRRAKFRKHNEIVALLEKAGALP